MRNVRATKVVALVLGIMLLGFFVAACGDDDDADEVAETEAPVEDADGLPQPPDVPPATIAYGEPAAVDEITQRHVDQVHFVTDWLGWDLRFVDGQGDIGAMAGGLETFINQGVDAVLVGSTDFALVEDPLSAANAQGIPTIAIGGGIDPNDPYTADFTEDEVLMSRMLTEQMVEDLNGEGEIFAMEITQLINGIQRTEGRDEVLADTDIEVVASQEGDLADPVEGSHQMAAAMMQGNPNVDAGWIIYDYMLPPAVQAAEELGLEDEVDFYTWFAGPENAQLLRERESVKALVENNFDHMSLVALDQILNHVVNGEDIDPNALEQCPLQYEVITEENVPEGENRVWEPEDNRAEFLENWSEGVFGEGANCG